MLTLPELITQSLCLERPRAFGERLGAPEWRYLSSTEMLARARAIACALRDAGLEHGDRVALISNNRLDWIAADFGILLAGCVVVPVFATSALDQVDYIFKDSEAKIAFVETLADAERLRAACTNVPRSIAFDDAGPGGLAAFEAAGAAAGAADPGRADSFSAALDPNELAVLIYTSGTTGIPKGVMLSHANLTTNAYEAFHYGLQDIHANDPILSVLPFAHIYEHTDLLGFIQFDTSLHVTQPDFLLADLQSIRPRTIALVPRIFERVLAGVVAKAHAEGGMKARLVPWALRVGREYMAALADGRSTPIGQRIAFTVARLLVLSKIRPALGLDRAEFLVSGSAPLHRDVLLTFAAIGVPVCEGYGLTETSPVVTASRVDALRYGSVGKPIPGVAVKIAADGEILVKGPNVMQGYYHLPEERPFTEDGWFQTGDIGRLDADGYLFITDRKKELFKTSTGKYVAPSRVEAAVKRSVYVAQVFVLGDGRPFPVALVAPNWALVRRQFGIPDDVSTAAIAERADVCAFIEKEVATNTADLAGFERIRRIALLPRDLTIEDGELSPTLKVKRRVVEARFKDLIDAAYAPAAATA